MMRTRRELTITWGPGATPLSNYTTTVPKGHRVTRARLMDRDERPADLREWFFADPDGLGFEPDSLELHDATHYGIPIPRDEIEGLESTP
jgi:hypothetical protein